MGFRTFEAIILALGAVVATTVACGSDSDASGAAGPDVDSGVANDGGIVEPPKDGGPSSRNDWKIFGTNEGLPSGDVRDLDVAKTTVWAATFGGVVRIEGDTVTAFRKANGLPSDKCTAVAVDAVHNRVWVGTEDAGITYYEGGAWHAGPPLPTTNIGALGVEPSGAVWIGAGSLDPQGLFRYQAPSAIETFSMDGSDVRSIVVNKLGEVWVGTSLKGVALRDVQGGWQWYNSSTLGFGVQVADQVYEADDGAMWIASRGDGLLRRSGTNWTVYNLQFDPQMPTADLTGVVVDASGVAWLATQGAGFLRLEYKPAEATTIAGKGVWKQLRTNNSPLPDKDNSLTDVVRDANDALWMAMPSGGIARLK